MKLQLLAAIVLVVISNNGVVFAQSPDRCFCESADNANCPPEAPNTLTSGDQVFCFGGYPGFCSVSGLWSIMCMWTTDVRGGKDAYPIASVISCNAGCTPLPNNGPGPQAEPPAEPPTEPPAEPPAEPVVVVIEPNTSDAPFLCESAGNASCPPEAPETLTLGNQVFCFGGYPGLCSVLYDSIICMRTTDVMGDSDTYPMASIVSCPPAEPAAAVTETIASDAPSDAPKPPPVTGADAWEDYEDDNHDYSVVDHDNTDTSAITASFKLGSSSLLVIPLMAAIYMV